MISVDPLCEEDDKIRKKDLKQQKQLAESRQNNETEGGDGLGADRIRPLHKNNLISFFSLLNGSYLTLYLRQVSFCKNSSMSFFFSFLLMIQHRLSSLQLIPVSEAQFLKCIGFFFFFFANLLVGVNEMPLTIPLVLI